MASHLAAPDAPKMVLMSSGDKPLLRICASALLPAAIINSAIGIGPHGALEIGE